jgi:hypothetical protein
MAKPSTTSGLFKPKKEANKKSYGPYNTEEYGAPTGPLSDDSKATAIGYGKFQEMGSPPRSKT